ncbi:DUF4892 domain-containing protein [Marinobacter zhejiangensis]|uniref:DUF4892 domain-containing protein n=1 Tax=Marinobacter zhejiangensis TaxID=488535 RepID=A0A1I4RSK8_9GAMM|nr:DUF4892 domain-containing protein [Marinobacter zhejiangensis]SFM55215.1 protein of unknown function [Marinobacter zhejiangensis]
MTRELRAVFGGLLAIMVLCSAIPASASDFLEAFPLSRVENEISIESPAHRILFSPVREVNDEIRSETMVRVPVSGIGQLMKIATDSDRRAARDYYRQRLQEVRASVLYECQGRDCGRSNVWANQIFGQATLYGRDDQQDYLAALVENNDRRWLVLVYTVTRGNQREYVWVEQLEIGADAVLPGAASDGGRVRGPIMVPWSGGVTVRFDWSSTDRRHLTSWASEPGAQVVLTSHAELQPNELLEQSMERAAQAADAMSALLAKTGVSEERQKILIVGPAIQFREPTRNADHIELLVILAP